MIRRKTTNNGIVSLLYAVSHRDEIDDNTAIRVDDGLCAASRGLFKKSMTGEEFIKTVDRPNTMLRQARKNFIDSYIADPGNATPLPVDYPDFADECYRQQTDSMRNLSAVITPTTVDFVKNSCIREFPKALENWMDRVSYCETVERAAAKLKTDSRHVNGGFVPNEVAEGLASLEGKLRGTEFELHVGHAGCGKSTAVIKKCNSAPEGTRMAIVSLSNTICNMFRQKVKNIDMFSCTKARYMYMLSSPKAVTDYDIVVIDEFSQWGFEQLELLNELLDNNPGAVFYMMGDIDQIPTFLSSGSLLYSIMDQFPEHVTEHNIQYRFANNPKYRDLVGGILSGQIPPGTVMNQMSNIILQAADCVITGANIHVEHMNQAMFNAKFGAAIGSNESLWDICRRYGTGKGEIKLICSKTTTVNSVKINCNTRYTVTGADQWHVDLRNEVDGTYMKIMRQQDLDYNFKLGYAITVNKAQGLEWDNVILYINSLDQNLCNKNALYVGLTRGKNNIIFTTDNVGTSSTRQMTIRDLQNILNITYRFYNNFKEV